MADWENLRHFAALARTGSLSAAARLLTVEHATVARRVAALEEEVGLKLVDRRGRRLSLTADGDRIAAIAERMEVEAQAVRRAADGGRSEIAGTVTISAPPALAAVMLAEPLVALQRSHPSLRIHIIGEARSASLHQREADVALRLNRPVKGDLVIVKVAQLAFRLYASSSYLAASTPQEWQFVAHDKPLEDVPQQRMLESVAKTTDFVFASAALEIQLALVRAGGGIAMLPDFMITGKDELEAVHTGEPALVRDLWLVTHSDMQNAAPIRAVVNSLKKWFLQQSGPLKNGMTERS